MYSVIYKRNGQYELVHKDSLDSQFGTGREVSNNYDLLKQSITAEWKDNTGELDESIVCYAEFNVK